MKFDPKDFVSYTIESRAFSSTTFEYTYTRKIFDNIYCSAKLFGNKPNGDRTLLAMK